LTGSRDGEAARTGAHAWLPELRLLGERLCFDFANTVDPRHGEHPTDLLAGYPDLVRWGKRAGALTAREAESLLGEAERHPKMAARAYEVARTLRERLHRVFSSIAASSVPDPRDLEALERAHAAAAAHARIVPSDGGYQWSSDDDLRALDRPLWPVVRDAVDLLTTGRLDRIRECPGPDGCGWLFYDTSRNGRRRWCSMDVCGNRAKGRRHYRRHRAAGSVKAPAR
jgi:predicted RNA-binding Zn ribbon-like protein